MRFGTGLSRGEFTPLAQCRATGRTTDREYLLWGEGLSHAEKILPMLPKSRQTGMVNFARSQLGAPKRRAVRVDRNMAEQIKFQSCCFPQCVLPNPYVV